MEFIAVFFYVCVCVCVCVCVSVTKFDTCETQLIILIPCKPYLLN